MRALSVGRNDSCPCAVKHCCLGKEIGVAFNQDAASASETLRKALEGQQFKSLEDAQAFVTRHAQVKNQRPREEFHGLSPEQMHRILNLPFASPELVCMPEVLATNPTAPVLTLFNLLIEATGEQGLKPTAKVIPGWPELK